MFGKKKTKVEHIQEETYDPYLLEQIQPSGGITFQDTRYVETGTGYETCIHVYDFPQKLDDFWMAKVCNINNTVVTVDISTDNVMEVQKNINRSMKEQQYRYMEAQNFQEKYDAKQRFQEMERLYEEISSLGEVIKLLHIRIFVADHSYIRLEEKVKNILAKLESNGFRAAIFLNETKTEWESMYRPYKEQQSEDLFFIYGQPLTSNALAAGNPFHFSSLQDPCGDFLGKTPCGGNVLFDEFHKSKTRRFYNSLAVGTMGSGKSTLLKKRFLTNAIKGNYVRTFDISGEFTTLTKTLGGKVLKLDGTNGILNPLEVLKAEEGEEISFTRHISKVSTIYKFLTEGSADTEEIIEFEELLRELYRTFGMELIGGKVKSQVTGLPANRYPTFSDFLEYIERKMEDIQRKSKGYEAVELDLVKHRMAIMDKIRRVLSNITNTYGSLFDGHTSIDNILDEQIVTFDLSTIKEMKPSVFDAQIFNMISLCWDNCVTNGKLMMERLRKAKGEEGALDPEQVTKFLMIIDESHRWINTKKRHALESITIYLREARKFFGGIMLASQSIRDYVPEGSGAEEIDDLKKIFELTQYKFIFHQEADTLPLLDKVFESTLTQSQRNKIPKLEIGENILCIASDRNLEFKVHLTKEEDRIFEGGV
jgi:predicted DNA-binding antitoxin AbrB/MazE fold protein